MAVLAAALASFAVIGCAGMGRPSSDVAMPSSYVGIFTGEYVDGLPLYRLPAIHVVGVRGSSSDD